jgi:hypothetical protein
VYVDRANPSIREYDQYGQQVGGGVAVAPQAGNASSYYLIAFRDRTIRAAVAYWLDGNVLHWINPEHESKQAMLDTVDRDMSRQLNAERRIPFNLPSK